MIIHNPELAKQIMDICSKPVSQEAKDNIQEKIDSVKVLFERKVSKMDLLEKKSVLSSISDNDLLNELIDRFIVNTNRNFIGIEKDDKYFEIAKKRIEEHLATAST